MTVFYLTILTLLFTTLFVYGQGSTAEECKPVNILLSKAPGNFCCSETGVRCNDSGHIEYLNLFYENYSGQIPSELGNLSQLTYLNLYDNELSGSIPKELGKLEKLEYLSLRSNKLSGTIPKELGNLTNLKELDLSFNGLSGPIPPELGKLEQLTFLNLGNNILNGTIPQDIGNLSKLEKLYLSNNKLSGSIPKEFESSNQLKEIDISNNNFCGGDSSKIINKITSTGNDHFLDKCTGDEIQQNNETSNNNDDRSNNNDDSSNEASKKNGASDKSSEYNGINDKTQKKNNGISSTTILIIVGVIVAILLIVIILAYFKKNKENSHISEVNLPFYNYIEDHYFEWKIENWDQLEDEEFSSVFEANKYLWKLILITNSFNEDNKESVDVGLTLCSEVDNNTFIYANFIIYFRNFNNDEVYKEVKYDDKPTFYNAKTLSHGINDAILISDLYDKRDDGCSILENNKIIIGVLIKFYTHS